MALGVPGVNPGSRNTLQWRSIPAFLASRKRPRGVATDVDLSSSTAAALGRWCRPLRAGLRFDLERQADSGWCYTKRPDGVAVL